MYLSEIQYQRKRRSDSKTHLDDDLDKKERKKIRYLSDQNDDFNDKKVSKQDIKRKRKAENLSEF